MIVTAALPPPATVVSNRTQSDGGGAGRVDGPDVTWVIAVRKGRGNPLTLTEIRGPSTRPG
ncbi:hypothetical protein JCM12141A_51560 [Mycolicibacterium hodleri]